MNKAFAGAYLTGFADGTIRPLGTVTRGEAAQLFYRLMTQEYRQRGLSGQSLFSDVLPGERYHTAVSAGAAAGLLLGDGSGKFYPDRPVTRAEFTAMAVRFIKGAEGGAPPFLDTGGHWASGEIAQAASLGWVRGHRGYFRPDDPITRAEAAAIVNRMLGRSEENLDANGAVWPDNPAGTWYYREIQLAAGQIEPAGPAVPSSRQRE